MVVAVQVVEVTHQMVQQVQLTQVVVAEVVK